MPEPRPQPFANMRFRIEVDGLDSGGAVEVLFPDALIVGGPRDERSLQFGALTIRRGLTRSTDWYDWWTAARDPRTKPRKVRVVLIDRDGADAVRWTFSGAMPQRYSLSSLNALGNETLIESLEVTVASFDATFAPPRARHRAR
jgi:hypothetical protein